MVHLWGKTPQGWKHQLIFNMCQSWQVSISEKLPFIGVKQFWMRITSLLCGMFAILERNSLTCWNMHIIYQVRAILHATLICFGQDGKLNVAMETFCLATLTAWQLAKLLPWHNCQSTYAGIGVCPSATLSKFSKKMYDGGIFPKVLS